MSAQSDLFGGAAVDLARSFPPHLDPEKVVDLRIEREVDRDAVSAGEVGRYGNNVETYVFRVLGAGGAVLYAEQCATIGAAEELEAHHRALLVVHAQRELW